MGVQNNHVNSPMDQSKERKPFLTRFFEEVLRHVPVTYKEFDYTKVKTKENDKNI